MAEGEIGPLIGSGKEAEVFEFGGRVVKLYKPTASKAAAFREAALLAMVERAGLPTPAVHGVGRFGERWGVIMDRATGQSFAAAMIERSQVEPQHLQAMARLHADIHSQAMPQLGSLKGRLEANIGCAVELGEGLRRRLLDGLERMPGGVQLCHGDFHPFNILGTPGAATVVDWLDATAGDPAADVARSFVLMRGFSEQLAEAYLDAYVAVGSVSRAGIAAWLPFVAAARLAEGVPAETASLLELAESV